MIASAATNAVAWRVSTTPSANVEWATPPAIYAALEKEFGFTLDAAACGSNAKHIRYVSKDTDALAIGWTGERVFCNPPYGRGMDRWVEKALHEAREGALVVMLLPARTDTIWFHRLVLPHAEIRFIQGRLSYTVGMVAGRRGRAPFGSMVAVFRPGLPASDRGRAQLLMPFLSKAP